MKKVIFLIIFLSPVFLYSWIPVKADCEQTDLQQKIDCLAAKVTELQGQTKTLAGQIAFYDSQIELAALKIKQTEDQINIFSTKIESLESKLQERSVLLKGQIVQTYKKGPLDGFQVLLSSGDVSELISRFKYLQIVQANNRKFLHDTQVVQTNYQQQKELISQSKKKLESQKQSLASIRAQRDALLSQTKDSESNYQKLLAQAQAELASLASFTKGYGLLPPQPQPDGYYFNQRDDRWGGHCIGNSCGNGPAYIYQVGCLITDVAMILKKNGQDVTPLTIAGDTSYFFSNTAYMLHSALAAHGFTVNGGYNQGLIDSELSSGRLVIVHLNVNTSDGHYVVLKSGANGDYVMNDPLTAANLAFKSSYSLGSINQIITYH